MPASCAPVPVAPGLVALGWTNASSIGWTNSGLDVVGSVALTPTAAVNTFGTLADFKVTGDFALTNSQNLTQTGTLQAGSARSDSNAASIALATIDVAGTLTLDGVVATGIDDGNARPGGKVFLSSTGNMRSRGHVAAVPSATAGGVASLSVGSGSTLTQTAGSIEGGSVTLAAPGGVTLQNATIVATTGTIGISADTVSTNELIAAVNTASGIDFLGNLTENGGYIGSNGTLVVRDRLTQNGGTLLAVTSVGLGSLAQTGGTIASGNTLAIGSSATRGSFTQSSGLLAASGNANIFASGILVQGTNGVLATGGTLGVTAAAGIDIAGTVSAAGAASGFSLLAEAGNVVLRPTGLLAGAALAMSGDSIPGNIVQAPAGTVTIAGTSGTAGFGRAGAIGNITPVTGYAIMDPPPPQLAVPTVAAAGATPTAVRLSGSAIDIERPVTASTLGLYATGTITEGPTATITAARLTGSSGANVALTQANVIGTMGAFNTAGHGFYLVDASNLMLAGEMTANSVRIEDTAHTIELTAGSAFAGLGAGSGSPLSSDPFPAAGSAGVYLHAANVTASHNPTITTGPVINGTFALTGNGNVGLGNFDQPKTKLFLDLATGTASGSVNVAGLQLRYSTATTETVNLTGVVGGVSGQTAAASSHIAPLPKNNYQINGCPISSVNCVRFSGLTIPVFNPLRDVQIGWLTPVSDDGEMLPDVAEQDY